MMQAWADHLDVLRKAHEAKLQTKVA